MLASAGRGFTFDPGQEAGARIKYAAELIEVCTRPNV